MKHVRKGSNLFQCSLRKTDALIQSVVDTRIHWCETPLQLSQFKQDHANTLCGYVMQFAGNVAPLFILRPQKSGGELRKLLFRSSSFGEFSKQNLLDLEKLCRALGHSRF